MENGILFMEVINISQSLLDKYSISRLENGTLLWTRNDMPVIYKEGDWVPAKGVTVGEANDSVPLTEEEIAALISDGILSQ